MSDLDDALNTPAPMLAPTTVQVDWQELPTGVSTTGVDSLRDFGQQMGPEGFEINHSFDDGLPDAVTVTPTNDASGSLGMDLVGRSSNVADIITGWRANTTNGSGSGLTIPVSLPAGLTEQDYVLVAVTADNASGVYENGYAEGHPWGWTLLAQVTDSTLTTYVFGRSHWLATPAPDFRIRTTGSWSWCVGALGANYTANNASIVPIRPGTALAAAETVTGTAHSAPTATLTGRGYALGVFAALNASGPWTGPTGGTQLVQSTGGVAALQMVKSAFIAEDTTQALASNTTGSTGVAMMVSVPLMVADRPELDAMAYFSEFDARSPIRNFERDTALVSAAVNFISPNGPVPTTLFSGQMSEIPVQGREADMNAVSRTRLMLDRSLMLPTVFGDREGCTTDWLASWLMANGGQYPGVAPSPNTRFWAPMHGSLHPFMSGNNVYPYAIYYDSTRTPKGPWGLKSPAIVDGPFVKAMQAQITNNLVNIVHINCATNAWDEEVPGQTTQKYDLLTQSNSIGRISFWIRGDANVVAPAALSGTGVTDHLFSLQIRSYRDAALNNNLVQIMINSARQPVIWLESGLTLTGGDLPTDGLWHFYGFAWDYANGLAKTRRDNVTWTSSGFTSSATPMAVSEEIIYSSGRQVELYMNSRLPIAEVQVEAGPTLYTDLFTRFYPSVALPSQNAIFRPVNHNLEAIAEPTPALGWSTLQQLAEATVSSLRVNELDNIELVPMEYFAETAQTAVNAYNVLDTAVNAGQLDITTDPTKIRNLVTLTYPDTRVDSTRAPLLDITSSVPITVGQTYITFPLENLAAEVHGAPGGVTWDITVLTAAQVSGATALPNEHFMSLNKYEDGSAVTYTGTGISAHIMGWTSSTVVIRFTNTSGATYFLANNGQGIPFLRILGYPVRRTDAFSDFRDTDSIVRRRERSLLMDSNPWVQDAIKANEMAGRIVTATSGPRSIMVLQVMGDPRRKPGQLVSIADSEGTRADGTWRIVAIKHKGSGAMFVQDITAVRVGPVLYWDLGLWDDSVWGD